MTRLFFFILILLSNLSLLAQPASDVGFRSLQIGRSAREAALGGKAIALCDDDANLALFTPSLLSANMHNKLNLNYINYFSDISMGHFSYVRQIDTLPFVVSAGVRFFDYGNFTQTDEFFNSFGTTNAGEWIAQGSLAYLIDSNFTVGATLKYIQSNFDSYKASAIAADLSASYYNPKSLFGATISLSDIGFVTKQYTTGSKSALPFDLAIGFSKKLAKSPLRFSVMADNLTTWDLTYTDPNVANQIDPITGAPRTTTNPSFTNKLFRHIYGGTEIVFSKNFNIRLGYNYRRRQELKLNEKPGTAGISWGFSFRINRFYLSYARAKYHLAAPSNHFTLSTSLSDFVKNKN